MEHFLCMFKLYKVKNSAPSLSETPGLESGLNFL